MKNILAALAFIDAFFADHSAFATCVKVDDREDHSASEIDRWKLAAERYSGQCALLLFEENTHLEGWHTGACSYV